MKFMEFGPPDLFKFCPTDKNPLNGCNTIRLGTLFGFRNIENELLRDEGEGEFEYKIRFPSLTQVSQEWISQFELGGGGSAQVGRMVVVNGKISIEDVTLKGSDHNCWIFCVSMSGDAAGNISEAHQDKWKVPSPRVNDFVSYLTQLLWENISASDLPDSLLGGSSLHQIQTGLSLSAEMRAVKYVDRREINIYNEQDFPVERIKNLKAEIPFMKPKRFEAEREFRFAFWLNYKNERVSITDKAKILHLRPIDRFLGSV